MLRARPGRGAPIFRDATDATPDTVAPSSKTLVTLRAKSTGVGQSGFFRTLVPVNGRGGRDTKISREQVKQKKIRQIAGKEIPDFGASQILVLSCPNNGYLAAISIIPVKEQNHAMSIT